MRRLSEVTVEGYKSIARQTLALNRLNVLIGGNGVGKSNFIGVFRFLRDIHEGRLQEAVAEAAGADRLLHFGRKRTPELMIRAVFCEEGAPLLTGYGLRLKPDESDSLFFAEEWVEFHDSAKHPRPYSDGLGQGHKQSLLPKAQTRIAQWVKQDLASYRVYHFHDTSKDARVKATGDVHENRFLHADARNLAAFLYWMQQQHPDRLSAIEQALRQIAPFFERLTLAPLRNNPEAIRLEWREHGSEQAFTAHQLSDGSLRFLCLATLLLQPEMPRLVLLDEPELGLHPAAIVMLAAMLNQAADRTQLIVSTQSSTLIDQLAPEQVWVADRDAAGATVFKHLRSEDLREWTDVYALGELWEKNVLGGRP